MKEKILIVDDEQAIVTLLTYNIEQAGYETDTAYDGLEAIRKAQNNDYDLIVLDLMLPKMDGLEVCKYLRRNDIDTPILMLTALDDEADKIAGLDIGADDYLTKPFSPKEVIARIRAILRRLQKLKKDVEKSFQNGALIVFPGQYKAMMNEREIDFTRKEFELLLFLIKRKGDILSRDLLLKEVWDYDFVGDTRIVDVHVSRLREKIEKDSKNPKYIKTIRGLGYKMENYDEESII